MKRLLLSLAAAAALIAPSAAVAETPIYGVWVREGHPTDKLEFYDCAGKLCARGIQPMVDGSPAPEILRKAAKTAPNNWKGDLFNPEDGKTYTVPKVRFCLYCCFLCVLLSLCVCMKKTKKCCCGRTEWTWISHHHHVKK